MRSQARVMYPAHTQVEYSMLCRVLYLRDDIVRHLKQLNYIQKNKIGGKEISIIFDFPNPCS
jgi:hypothetical protein